MKKIALIIILTLVLSSCSNPKTITTTSNSPTGSPANSPTNKPTSSPTSKPASNSTTSTNGTNLAMEAYKKVLQNEGNFFSSYYKKYVDLSKLLSESFPGTLMKITRFTVLDMDGDDIPEVVLELAPGENPVGFEVLHYTNGTVYDYSRTYRGLMGLKTDGTFSYSSGVADNGFGKLRFSPNGCEVDILGCRKPSTNNDGILTASCFINNKPVTDEVYDSFIKEQYGKKDVTWYEFSPKNIETELSKLSQPTITPQPVSDSKDESAQIIDLIKKYEELLPKAINANDFSLVETCLLLDSSLYVSQKKLVANLYSQNIKEKLISHDVVRINFEGKGLYKVLVVESIAINYPQKGEEIKEFHWIYTANKVDNSIKLSNIEEWKDFDKFIK